MIISNLRNNNINRNISDNKSTTAVNSNNCYDVFSRFSLPYINAINSYASAQIVKTPQLSGNTLNDAMNELKNIVFSQEDIKHMQNLGVNVRFNSGKEIADFIKNNNIKVEFDKMDCDGAHAQWDKENNRITINDKYKNTNDPVIIIAISEAICHEVGHAKDADDVSSRKEELDCLALNTLANRYHRRAYPKLFKENSEAEILKNGVNLYTELFFDPDPKKEKLVKRILDKYGDLPVESPNHKTTMQTPVTVGISK